MKFRKKPIVIEAVQWTGDNDHVLRAFAGDRWRGPFTAWRTDSNYGQIYDVLHDTWINVFQGQWVIKGPSGEFYPIAPATLAATYDEVSDSSQPTAEEIRLSEEAENVGVNLP